MAGLPGVNIRIANGQLGRVGSTADNVAALVLSGVTVSPSQAFGHFGISMFSPVALFEFADLEKKYGVTKENNPLAYKDVKAFYSQTGPGAELWLMLYPNTYDLEDVITGPRLQSLITKTLGRLRLIGVNKIYNPQASITLDFGLDADVLNTLYILHAEAIDYANQYKPFRAVIPGIGFDGGFEDLQDLRTGGENRVSVLMGADEVLPDINGDDNSSAAIGLIIGRLAAIPVMRSIARVKDGDLGIKQAYSTDRSAIQQISDFESNWDMLHDKGYIFIRSIPGKKGYYFTDDPTATALTDDYSSIARGRVIDKAMMIAYVTFIEELNDEIPVDAETGKINAALVAEWEANLERAIGIQMAGEIVSVECRIDPDQNVLSTDKISATVAVIPVGYAKKIEVTLGLSNPYKID